MANHSSTPDCLIAQADDGSFRLNTLRYVQPGEALCRSYGDLSNDALLLSYGFFQNGNAHDHVMIPFTTELLQVVPTLATAALAAFSHQSRSAD